MSILSYFRNFFYGPPKDTAKRDFYGALQSRLTEDWVGVGGNADSEIRSSLKMLRGRCRDLWNNNDYVRRYAKLLNNNVLGANGIGLQMKIREPFKDPETGQWGERYDTRANRIIEDMWWGWGRAKNCTLGKQLCWVDVQRIALESVARDGSILIRKHFLSNHPHKFCIELIESDQLDTDFNATERNGVVIRLGVEYSAEGSVTAYHVLRQHPGELYQPRTGMSGPAWRERVTADKMIHLFMPDRVGQSTGVPWLITAMTRLNHLNAYEHAEVVAARLGACKMGFLEAQSNAAGLGYTGPTDAKGNKYMNATPGNIEQLPYGYTFKSFDPTHPNAGFKDFVKATLRGISAGLGVSYTSLANDLESVNYSSIRAGLLEEREEWKTVQNWFINWFITPVFESWLESVSSWSLLTDGQITLPASKIAKWNNPEWKPRRWGWVDPLADLQAQVLAVEKGFKSRREMIAENGGDIEATFADIKADEDLAEQHGIDFDDESGQQANSQQTTPDKPDDPKKPLTPAKG